MAKFVFTIYSPYVGADVFDEVEIDDADLEGLTTEERENVIHETLKEWVESTIETSWKEIEE